MQGDTVEHPDTVGEEVTVGHSLDVAVRAAAVAECTDGEGLVERDRVPVAQREELPVKLPVTLGLLELLLLTLKLALPLAELLKLPQVEGEALSVPLPLEVFDDEALRLCEGLPVVVLDSELDREEETQLVDVRHKVGEVVGEEEKPMLAEAEEERDADAQPERVPLGVGDKVPERDGEREEVPLDVRFDVALDDAQLEDDTVSEGEFVGLGVVLRLFEGQAVVVVEEEALPDGVCVTEEHALTLGEDEEEREEQAEAVEEGDMEFAPLRDAAKLKVGDTELEVETELQTEAVMLLQLVEEAVAVTVVDAEWEGVNDVERHEELEALGQRLLLCVCVGDVVVLKLWLGVAVLQPLGEEDAEPPPRNSAAFALGETLLEPQGDGLGEDVEETLRDAVTVAQEVEQGDAVGEMLKEGDVDVVRDKVEVALGVVLAQLLAQLEGDVVTVLHAESEGEELKLPDTVEQTVPVELTVEEGDAVQVAVTQLELEGDEEFEAYSPDALAVGETDCDKLALTVLLTVSVPQLEELEVAEAVMLTVALTVAVLQREPLRVPEMLGVDVVQAVIEVLGLAVAVKLLLTQPVLVTLLEGQDDTESDTVWLPVLQLVALTV